MPSVILFAHMDQLGFMVKKIEDNEALLQNEVSKKELKRNDIFMLLTTFKDAYYMFENRISKQSFFL